MPTDTEVQVPSSKDRRRLEVPAYLHEQLQQIAARESRTVASVASELLHFALRDHRPRWIPNEHLKLFNGRARHVLDLAKEEALSFDHNYIGTEHLLLGLLREDQGSAAQYLTSQGVELEKVREAVLHHIGRGDKPASGEIEYTPRTRRALALAVDGAHSLGHDRIGTEHILLGLAREGQGVAAGVLERMGIDLEELRQRKLPVLSQLD
jgi:ATP-dependent Clp protease ATP-binding subunit ClpC